MNIFQTIDLFGKPIFLNFDGATRAKTRAGGIFSLLFFGFIIWAAYHVSQDLFQHMNPKTISSEFFSENPEQMVLNPDTFTFGFGIQDPNTFAHYIDDSVYTLNVVKTRLDNILKSDGTIDQKWSRVKLETERCKTSHFGDLGDKFAGIELDKLFCFTPAQTESGELRIQGVFESPVYEFISISIVECNPAVRACASEERRKALLEGGWFAVYFTNMAFDPRDYNDPSFKYRDSTYTTFGKNYFKEASMLLSHVQVTSDSGWITREPETKNYIKFDSQRELLNLRSDLSDFFNFVIRVNKITTKHDRSYVKVQDIIAEVNGLATIGLLAAFIIVSPYSNLKFYEGLINELFDIKLLNNKLKTSKRDSKRKKSLRKQMSLSHHIAQYIKPKNQNDEDGIGKGVQIMTPSKSALKYDFDDGSPGLQEVKTGNELKVNKGLQKKATFWKISLEENGDSPLAHIEQQEREIMQNREFRKKSSSSATGSPSRFVTQKVDTEQPGKEKELKKIRGSLKKPSYFKSSSPKRLNAPDAEIEQTEFERNGRSNRKKTSFAEGSIAENVNYHLGEIDECNNNRAPSDMYSPELRKNPFNYPVSDNRNGTRKQELELQHNPGMNRYPSFSARKASENRNIDNEVSPGLQTEKLLQDVPRAIKPQVKVENYENHHDSVEIILESLILENEQERKRTEDGKRIQQGTPRAEKPKLRVINHDGDGKVVELAMDAFKEGQEGKDGVEIESRENIPSRKDCDQEEGVRKESRMSRRVEDEDLFSPEVASVPIVREAGSRTTLIMRDENKLNLTFWEYVKSYVWKTEELREKLSVLNEGRRRVDERLDIFNVFKKLREVDKLKLLLLENEQLVLFDGLPKPELKSKNCLDLEGSKSLSRHLLKEARFISERRKHDLIAISYENLKDKPEVSLIDQKLLDIYDDMMKA